MSVPGGSNHRNTLTMTVYVNDKPVDIFPGMTVKHALLTAGLLERNRGIKESLRRMGE